MHKTSLEDKMDLASAKRYAWDEGFAAGRLYSMDETATEVPKNPWYLLIFRYYNKM